MSICSVMVIPLHNCSLLSPLSSIPPYKQSLPFPSILHNLPQPLPNSHPHMHGSCNPSELVSVDLRNPEVYSETLEFYSETESLLRNLEVFLETLEFTQKTLSLLINLEFTQKAWSLIRSPRVYLEVRNHGVCSETLGFTQKRWSLLRKPEVNFKMWGLLRNPGDYLENLEFTQKPWSLLRNPGDHTV